MCNKTDLPNISSNSPTPLKCSVSQTNRRNMLLICFRIKARSPKNLPQMRCSTVLRKSRSRGSSESNKSKSYKRKCSLKLCLIETGFINTFTGRGKYDCYKLSYYILQYGTVKTNTSAGKGQGTLMPMPNGQDMADRDASVRKVSQTNSHMCQTIIPIIWKLYIMSTRTKASVGEPFDQFLVLLILIVYFYILLDSKTKYFGTQLLKLMCKIQAGAHFVSTQ